MSQIEAYARTEPVPPADLPFLHADRCRLVDEVLPWERVEKGKWKQTCMCSTRYWDAPTTLNRPASPDPSAHRHGCDPDEVSLTCTARASVVWEDGCWKTKCRLCETVQYHLPPSWHGETARATVLGRASDARASRTQSAAARSSAKGD